MSSIKVSMVVERPEEVTMTLSITMPLRRWEEIRAQLVSAYPSWALASIIGNAVSDVRHRFTETQEYLAP